ncbi:MAG: hypothetical protein U1E15_02625 [Hyphomicrobiales bacterium]
MGGIVRWFLDGAEELPGQTPMPAHAVQWMTGEAGTSIRWTVGVRNFASLTAVCSELTRATLPIMLHFFSGGWFEERHDTAAEAIARIEALMMRGDVVLPGRIFVRASEPHARTMPATLHEVWQSKAVPHDLAVHCVLEPDSGSFVVVDVGRSSAIGRVWGTSPSSWPCLPMGAYGASATDAYFRAVEDGQPRYDQVVAALRFPDENLRWVSYHRIIQPERSVHGRLAVSVVSEYGDVGFHVI